MPNLRGCCLVNNVTEVFIQGKTKPTHMGKETYICEKRLTQKTYISSQFRTIIRSLIIGATPYLRAYFLVNDVVEVLIYVERNININL